MKKFFCLALTFLLAATILWGCSKKKKLLGTWECTLDLSPTVTQTLTDVDFGSQFTVSDFTVSAQLSFLKDGTFTLQLDPDELDASLETLCSELEADLFAMLQSQLQEQSLPLSLEELLALSGLSSDDLTHQLRQRFQDLALGQTLAAQCALEGYYHVKGQRILFAPQAEASIDEHYIPFAIEETTLTLSQQVGQNPFLADNLILGSTSVSFTRAG